MDSTPPFTFGAFRAGFVSGLLRFRDFSDKFTATVFYCVLSALVVSKFKWLCE